MPKKAIQIDHLNKLIKEPDSLAIISTNTAIFMIATWFMGIIGCVTAAIEIPVLIVKPIAILAVLFLSYAISTSYRKVLFDLNQKIVFVRRGSLHGKLEYEAWTPIPFNKVNLYPSEYFIGMKFETIVNMNGKTLIKCDSKKTAQRIINLIHESCPEIDH